MSATKTLRALFPNDDAYRMYKEWAVTGLGSTFLLPRAESFKERAVWEDDDFEGVTIRITINRYACEILPHTHEAEMVWKSALIAEFGEPEECGGRYIWEH